jgi:hypothetical protein
MAPLADTATVRRAINGDFINDFSRSSLAGHGENLSGTEYEKILDKHPMFNVLRLMSMNRKIKIPYTSENILIANVPLQNIS